MGWIKITKGFDNQRYYCSKGNGEFGEFRKDGKIYSRIKPIHTRLNIRFKRTRERCELDCRSLSEALERQFCPAMQIILDLSTYRDLREYKKKIEERKREYTSMWHSISQAGNAVEIIE